MLLPQLTRRACLALAAAALGGQRPLASTADDAGPPLVTSPPLVAGPPLVTSRVDLGISVGTGEARTLPVGLYGEAAPASSALFRQLCEGSVPGVAELTYRGSTASRIEKDQLIVLGKPSGGVAQYIDRTIDNTGYVRSELINRADGYANADAGAPSGHDRAALVSMRRGGGAFEFALSPRANRALDADWIVVGEVGAEGLPLLDELNAVPARKPTATSVVYGAAAKAGGDVRSRIEQEFRPLLKVQIRACRAL